MNEAVDGGEGHGWIREDRVPGTEWLVGRDQHGAAFVACADQFEQHAGLGLILCDVGDVVEDQQVELVELCDGAFEGEIAARLLQLLDQVRSVVRVKRTR